MTTDAIEAEAKAMKVANEALLDGCAGLSIAYLAHRVKDLEAARLKDAAQLTLAQTRVDQLAKDVESLNKSLSKAREAFSKLKAGSDDQKAKPTTPPPGGKGAA